MLSRLLLARSIRNHSKNDNSWDTFIGLLAPTAWYKLHEPDGLVAGDSSGNGKDAVYPESGITFNQPSGLINIGNGITNIASSNFFTQRAHDAAFDVRGDITLIATVKIAASHPNYPKIIWQPTDIYFGRGTWYLGQDYVNSGGRFVFRISIGGTNIDVVSTTVPMVGVTYLVTCRRSGTTMDMYINGVREATRSSVTGMADIASLPFMLGGSGNGDGNGSVVSNVAIFNRALYDEDIVALYGMAVGASGDPYWNKVKSLLHYNGPDGSTVFTDEKNNVIGGNNGALITADAGPWGGSCVNLTSGNSQIFSSAPATNFDLGAGDFTVETMLKVPATATSTGCIMGKWNGNGQYCWMMLVGASNTLGFSASNTGNYIATYDLGVANVIIPGKWQHIAVCKSGTTLRFFVEGVLKSTASLPISVLAGNTYWDVGFNGIGQKAKVYLAESRITVGIARYTADFTPYTRPFYNRSVGWVDDFSSNTISQYTAYSDTTASWTILGGVLTGSSSPGAQSVLTRNGVVFADGEVSGVITSADDAGLAVRYTDNGNYYVGVISDASATLTPNSVALYKRVGGTFTLIGARTAIDFTRGTAHTFTVGIVGTSVYVNFDGVAKINVTDSSLVAAGMCGPRTNVGTATFDSFMWPAIP